MLQFLRTKVGMAILYEDMLTSAPGWTSESLGDAGADFVFDEGTAVPTSDDEAMALWRKLGIAERTVDAATSALTGWKGEDIMAEALLRHGDFACKRFVENDECGQSEAHWEFVPPETGWDDACVQREAASWAISNLSKRRFLAMADTLVGIAGSKPPEDELPELILARGKEMPEKLRLRVVRAMLAARCNEEGCDISKPKEVVAELSVKSRIALYQDAELASAVREAAIAGVDLSFRPDLLVEVYGDEDLDLELRESLWPLLSRQKPAVVERALRLAAKDDQCGFAMAAIEQLAELGKKDLLPRAGKDDPGRVVCLLLNARDDAWASREFRKLLPKRGKILFTEESQDDMDGEGGQTKTSQEKIPVRDMDLGLLPEALREHAGRVETSTSGHVETVSMVFDADGLLSAVHKTSWSGCPC